ncbi:hypothetical protein BJY04DRAFT_216100 [Aspergillus karnatakaensis]|uniref:uncharacterized protein n=1 Tax=Aspergillus karnatakaensis TaxID=1810916 RepID=UPI003CCCB804
MVDPDTLKKDFCIQRGTFPSSARLALLPIDGFGNILQTTSFDTPANLVQRSDTTTKCGQNQMTSHVEADEQCSITPNGLSNADMLRREAQAGGDQMSHWHAEFPSTHRIPFDSYRSQPSSQSPNSWKVHTPLHTSPVSQLAVEDIGSVRSSGPAPALIHPIPKQAPYTVTSYFSSESVPESISAFGPTDAAQEGHVSEGDRCLMRGSDWTTDDLVFPGLLHDRQSPGTTSITTVNEKYTPSTADGTYNDGTVTPWPSLTAQVPWAGQRHNVPQDDGDAAWDDAQIYSAISQQSQQQDHFDRYPLANDNPNGLPTLGSSGQAFIQPSSLLDPYRSNAGYLDDGTVGQSEHNLTQPFGDNFSYQGGPRPNDTSDSFFDGFGQDPYQPYHAGRIGGPWSNDARNAFLIEYKRRGLSYKDIKRLGGFKEAESTLRGRFRTLTKSKEQRVRKPHWYENDVRLLCEAVNLYSETGLNTCASACRSRRGSQAAKIPWKKVAQYIRSHGGSYHFGNATCKKKWCVVSDDE